MAGKLARVSASDSNVIELDLVRPGRTQHDAVGANSAADLCTDFSPSSRPRKAKKARKKELTPALIDDLTVGKLDDSKTGGLAIEVLPSGKKRWGFRRRIVGRGDVVKLSLGLYPAYTIAAARQWANGLNLQLDAGIDPRETARGEERLATMTVDRAHGLYMEAARDGRSSRAKRTNKPRTIADKLEIYRRDVAPKLGRKIIYDVTELDLIKLVEAKAKSAKIRSNRLSAELRVFFGWAASLRGLEIGLEVDPSRRLGDLRFPEVARTRTLSLQEIEWFMIALVDEERDYRRGMLLWLLSAARLSELVRAPSCEVVDGVWTIASERTKNSVEHRIALGPWGQRLMQSDSEWVFPSPRGDGPRSTTPWYKARDRVHRRMEALAGRPIARFSPHDFRRTARSNTKRLRVDYETAEAMLNHVKKGMERTYDQYALEDEKREWFWRWEREMAMIACRANVSDALEVVFDAALD
jgi:integrase